MHKDKFIFGNISIRIPSTYSGNSVEISKGIRIDMDKWDHSKNWDFNVFKLAK